MLAINNLSVAFVRYAGLTKRERLLCLHGISLSIDAGEVLAVVGASGAGKSLLAHAVMGLLPSNAEVDGTMTFAGASLTPQRQAMLRGRQIALVPQSIACLDPLARVRRQIEAAARRAGTPASRSQDVAARALARFGLGASVGRAFPHELSGGMARRVLLAIATVGDPGLIIADEPTNGLDEDNTAMVLSDLRSLANAGKGVMLISHDIRSALAMADRVAVVRHDTTVEVAAANGFAGDGHALSSDYARRLWRALPEHEFIDALAPVAGAA